MSFKMMQREPVVARVGELRVGSRAGVPRHPSFRETGVTYTMAQAIEWLDSEHFAVGRWDGSLDVFRFSNVDNLGPLATKPGASPALEGVQAIARLSDTSFVSTNDEGSLCTWMKKSDGWESLEANTPLAYDPVLGPLSSASVGTGDGKRLLLAGHANGFVSCWPIRSSQITTPSHVLDVRSDSPVNPWGLQNVRDIVVTNIGGKSVGLAGSENGEVTAFEVGSAKVLFRSKYNKTASFGINTLDVRGNQLLLGNCSGSPEDKNLWAYRLEETGLVPLDAVHLRRDTLDPQVFNFCTRWGELDKKPCFFCSTEDGCLWAGVITSSNRIEIKHRTEISSPLGAAIAFRSPGRLVAAAHNLYEFTTI